MSTVTAAITAALSAAGVPQGLWPVRDEGGERSLAAMPYTVAKEGVSTVVSKGRGRGVLRRSELVQIDLLQNRLAGPDDPTLMASIWAALDAAPRSGALIRMEPVSSVRRYDRATQIVTESLTVRVEHTA